MRFTSVFLALALSASGAFAHDIRASLIESIKGKPDRIVWSSTLSLDLANPNARVEADSTTQTPYVSRIETRFPASGPISVVREMSNASSGASLRLASAPNSAGVYGDRVQARFQFNELMSLRSFPVRELPSDPIQIPVVESRTAMIESLPLSSGERVEAASFLFSDGSNQTKRVLKLLLERLN